MKFLRNRGDKMRGKMMAAKYQIGMKWTDWKSLATPSIIDHHTLD